jgi:hypothetical protein
MDSIPLPIGCSETARRTAVPSAHSSYHRDVDVLQTLGGDGPFVEPIAPDVVLRLSVRQLLAHLD